jgi:hypothetical protein
MSSEWKIVKKEDKSFRRKLEDRARFIARDEDIWDSSAISAVEREIALTIEQIEHLKEVNKESKQSLSASECSVCTDILNLEPRPLQYFDNNLKERNNLKTKVLKIDEQRRKLSSEGNDKLRVLQDRLLFLMNRLEELRTENEH